ncbi:class I SAM-dependent methyltransferase [Ktedonobacteria bacterium brp13]|nr:class I SAM-dependent methyltransferase [Ktedonobacteria bacterium brp13]
MDIFSFLTNKKQKPLSNYHQLPKLQVSFIRGRRHRVDVPYALPKDELEEERINFQHYALHKLLGGNYHAPIDHTVERILDVGTGTAQWAYDIARQFPHAQVCGLDLEQSRGTGFLSPENYSFVQGNILEPLPFPDNTFDFVHQRLLVSAIPTAHWPTVVQELIRVTRPGGYIELAEAGNCYHHVGVHTYTFLQWGQAASAQRSIDLATMKHLGELLARAKLGHINTRTFLLPVGSWGGKEGALYAKDMYAAFQGLKNFFCQVGGIDPHQFDATLSALPQEWEAYHTTHEFYVAYGQK